MRGFFRQLVPSMFARRLLMLAGLAAIVMAGLMLQMVRLTVVEGAQWRERAESVLVATRLIPTSRGRIVDRHGRPLAEEAPVDELRVHYDVITGRWAYERARWAAYRANRHRWGELDYPAKAKLIDEHQQAFDDQIESLWQTLCQIGGLPRVELDERKATIIRRVEQIARACWWQRYQDRVDAVDEPVAWADVAQPIGEQVAAHALLPRLSAPGQLTASRLIAQAQDDADAVWSQVKLAPSSKRLYPSEQAVVTVDLSTFPGPLRAGRVIDMPVDGVGVHLVGAMRSAPPSVMRDRPFYMEQTPGSQGLDLGGYLAGDESGAFGAELAHERLLRGLRGREMQFLDGRERQRLEPTPGIDVQLSIDIHLQARLRALMDPSLGLTAAQDWFAKQLTVPVGAPLHGAAVVLDVATGEVLAAVSAPGFTRQQLADAPDTVWQDRLNRPALNRVISRPYEPGSTVKPLVLAAAITAGRFQPGATIDCIGAFDPNHRNRLRCWIFKHYQQTHGPLSGPAAIEQSCNIFFYTLGQRMTAGPLIQWYRRFGLAQRTGCGLPGERPGYLPNWDSDPAQSDRVSQQETILMGIGQGPIEWTPLQAAASYAAIARGGYYISPTFLSRAWLAQINELKAQGRISQAPPMPQAYDLGLTAPAVEQAMAGLDRAVNSSAGTTHHIAQLGREPIFNIQGVHIWGKSGTATARALWVDDNNDGQRDAGEYKRDGDHAWFVGLVSRADAPAGPPAYAIAVVLEYAGSGGAAAGPLANQILHALRAEGYL